MTADDSADSTQISADVNRPQWWNYVLHPVRTSCWFFDEANRIAQSGQFDGPTHQ